MTGRHAVPEDIFAALAAGGGGERAMRLLVRTQQGKHLALLRMVLASAKQVQHPRVEDFARAYDLIARAQLEQPEDVEPLLRHPPVGAWAIRALRDLRSASTVDIGYLTALAAAAALLTRSDCEVAVPLRDRSLFLPLLGRIRLPLTDPPDTVTVRSSRDGAYIVAAGTCLPIPANPRLDSDSWEAIRKLTVRTKGATTSFLLDDLDPYRFPEQRTAARIEVSELRHWQQTLSDAWALLADHHEETALEVAAGVTVLVPLCSGPGHDVSATSRHSFGTIALSTPGDGASFAATFAHERQHAKLSALLDLIPLISAPGKNRWYAPWRNDPRPLGGLLQGAYAHLGVAGFWRRQRLFDHHEMSLEPHVEFARWRDGTRDAVATLQASGALTALGTRFVDGMAETLDTWRAEPVPAEALQQARTAAHQHQEAWQQRNGQLGDHSAQRRISTTAEARSPG
ncbi:MAG: HEXXH motif domain-containing protein [Pseudonocardiaceae bacterium]